MSNSSRVQPGVPTGGQFAPTTHAESDVQLTDDVITDEMVDEGADDRDTDWKFGDDDSEGNNQEVVNEILGIGPDVVRENFTSAHDDPDVLVGVTDDVLRTEIAEHGKAIDRAAELAEAGDEQAAWKEMNGLCDSIARHAIKRAQSEETVAADGSLSLMEWQRRTEGRNTVPLQVPDPITPGHPAVVYGLEAPMRGEVLAGPYAHPLIDPRHGLYDVLANGRVHRVSTTITASAEDFDQAWHVVKDGRIIAGGRKISEDRAREIAAERGGDVQQGF